MAPLRNMTITLEEEAARWARIRAAELETSVSRFVGKLVRDEMDREQTYERAREDYFSRGPREPISDGSPYPTRDEAHERHGLR